MKFNILKSWKGYYATMKGKNIKEIFPFIEYDDNNKCYFIDRLGYKIKLYEISKEEYKIVIKRDKDFKIKKYSLLFLIFFNIFAYIFLISLPSNFDLMNTNIINVTYGYFV